MAIDVSDDFTGFTSGNLEDRTNWDLNHGSTGDMTGAANEILVTGNLGAGTYNWTTAFDTNSVSVSCTVDPTTAATGTFRACGPMVITNLAAFTGYYFRAARTSGNVNTHNLEIVLAGAFQDGANDTASWVADEKLTITVTDIGGGLVDVKGYIDDVLSSTAQIDGATAVGGSTWYAGVYGASQNASAQPTMDNFEASDVSGTSPLVLYTVPGLSVTNP